MTSPTFRDLQFARHLLVKKRQIRELRSLRAYSDQSYRSLLIDLSRNLCSDPDKSYGNSNDSSISTEDFLIMLRKKSDIDDIDEKLFALEEEFAALDEEHTRLEWELVHFESLIYENIFQQGPESTSSLSSWITFSENFQSVPDERHGNLDESVMGTETSSQPWTRFNQATQRFKGLVNYETLYKWYIDQALENMINEKIMYAELQPMLLDEHFAKEWCRTLSNAQEDGGCRVSSPNLLPLVKWDEDSYELYASDITRTFPLSGTWPSKESEHAYKFLNGMQEACIQKLASGVRHFDLHDLFPVPDTHSRHPITDRGMYSVPTLLPPKVSFRASINFEMEHGHELQWLRAGEFIGQACRTLLLHISRTTKLLNRASSGLVLSGALLCLLGKAHAMENSVGTTQNGCWNAFLQYVFASTLMGTIFRGYLIEGGLPYFMAALSLAWPIIKTDTRSSIPLTYGVYLAHLVATAAYGYVSFRDHNEPRSSWFLSIMLCAITSMIILFSSPSGMDSLLTFLPPVESLSVFIVANGALIGDMLRGLTDYVWQQFCHLVRYCSNRLGGGIQFVGQLLRGPTRGRDTDEESF